MPKKRASRPLRFAPLQRAVSETVTDPAEIAAAEKLYKQFKRMQREQEGKLYGKRVKNRPLRFAPLQRAVSETVTDPAEIAAAEKLYKRLKREYKEEEELVVYRSVKKSPKKTTKRRPRSEPRP